MIKSVSLFCYMVITVNLFKFVARLLRYLATHHVYKEISPDIFVNNRISSLLDTGKSVKNILAKYVTSILISNFVSNLF